MGKVAKHKKEWKTMDGNMAASHIAYAFTEVAAIFPITPSSNMPEYVDEWAAYGQKNIFGHPVQVVELQSEAGAAGAVHGALSAGSLATTFTASQGLLLMIPNMYKIAGELLPGVFHVSARAVAAHALSIFGDHSDVMSTRSTGFAMLAGGSVQEVMDISAVAHLCAIKGSLPFLNFFDGFRTSHEVQKIEVIDYEDLAKLVDWQALSVFRDRAMRPEKPFQKGTAQNPDIFFQAKEAASPFYELIPDMVEKCMQEIKEITGREYHPFNYYGHPEAERVIIAMGSVCQTTEEVVDYLNAQGERVGVVEVHLFRPFSPKYFFRVLPASVQSIAVLDRCKEPGAIGEPLYEDVRTMFFEKGCCAPTIVGGRYGLGSKDTTPSQIKAVFDNLKLYEPRNHFTVGIVDDISNSNLEIKDEIVTAPEDMTRCKFWGLGSDGTVGANKNSIKIIGDYTDMYAQGYFSYDSKKSGGITVSHLRFGKSPIKSTYLVSDSDFVACHKQEYVNQYNITKGLKKGGVFLLNTNWMTLEQLEENLPSKMKRYLAENEIKFYIIDATEEAEKLGLGNRTNTIMQSAFFKLAKVIPIEDAVKYMKEAVEHTYGRKGEAVVKQNNDAVDAGHMKLVEIMIPDSWKDAEGEPKPKPGLPSHIPCFIKEVVDVINAQDGDSLPSSMFKGREDGHFPSGTSAFEKRGVAVHVPEWLGDKCVQCNKCSFVCPHAAIRPFLLNGEEQSNAPANFGAVDTKPKPSDVKFKMQVDVLDCMGCGNCAELCPVKALPMKPIATQMEQIPNWTFAVENVSDKEDPATKFTIKGSQFCRPLLEFSGACTGCGETPYTKLITQLFGDRMIISNATGCSSIWGGSAPSMPYTKNAEGKGPAWGNSLFEDNAEYAYGMRLAINVFVKYLLEAADALLAMDDVQVPQDMKAALKEWVEDHDDGEKSKIAAAKLIKMLEGYSELKCENPCSEKAPCERCKHGMQILKYKDYLVKKSIWAFGGDGWAYDIGYGGLDHVIASGMDVNIFVMDTEVYSNTGGQSSKSTPTAAIAKFAASGKRTRKKDLGRMAITYGNVYVAQVGMEADNNQLLKAFKEAEAHKGPSLVIAYAPCIAHGIKAGMGKSQEQIKKAVEAGYWHLYRFNPDADKKFTLDSKEPKASFREFIMGETRYASLLQDFPAVAEALFEQTEQEAKERYEAYKTMAELGQQPVKA